MKSKISFFKPGIIIQDFRQYGWIAIIFTIGLLLTGPVSLLIKASNKYFQTSDFKSLSELMTDRLEVLVLFTVPVACGVMVFRYLQSESSADFVHSFPIRRESLYINHIISGLLMMIVPILINTGVLFAVINTNPLMNAIVENSEILYWTGIAILCSFFFFSTAVLVGMITGMSVFQAILTFIFILLPFGLYELILYQMKIFLYGFNPAYGINTEMLVPFLAYFNMQEDKSNSLLIIVYIVLTILFFIAGWFLYKNRKLENAQEVIAFEIMKPIFKYGVTFCSTLLGSTYFYSVSGSSFGWHVFGAVLGAAVGYFVSEMLVQKNWRVFHWKTLIGFISFSVAMAIVFTALATDAFGYGKRLPEENEIAGVRVFQNDFNWQNKEESAGFSEDRAYILNTREFQRLIIDQKEMNENENDFDANQFIAIEYKLKDGKRFKRYYSINGKMYVPQLSVLYETTDFKKQRYAELANLNSEITIGGLLSQKTELTIKDPEDINELKETLLKDLMSMTYNELHAGDDLGYIAFVRKEQESIHIPWNSSFEHVKNWLDEKNLLVQVFPAPEEVRNIVVTDESYRDREIDVDTISNKVEVTQKGVIKNALENSEADSGEHVFVKVNFVNGSVWEGALPKEAFPKEVTDQVNEGE